MHFNLFMSLFQHLAQQVKIYAGIYCVFAKNINGRILYLTFSFHIKVTIGATLGAKRLLMSLL